MLVGKRMAIALAAVALLGTAAAMGSVHAQTPASASTLDRAVAIVVHPATRIDDLSFDQLQRIFRGDQQFWPDGSRVTLLIRAPISEERKLVLSKIYRMSEDQFRQFWIAKMFRAEVAAGPKIVYSSEMTSELVSVITGAIGFMPATSVGSGVKVIRINGKLPSDQGYPLR